MIGDFDVLVDRVGEGPVQARAEQRLLAFAHRLAKPQHDRPLLRADREEAGAEENAARSTTITNLTMAKLLRSASDSACEPASTGVSGGGRGSGCVVVCG